MLFRFIGRYTNGHTSISACGVTFEGNEPADVTEPEGIRRLSQNIEFEAVEAAPEAPPKRRGRPRKAGS